MLDTKEGEYITFVIELEAAVDKTLEHLEECISRRAINFLDIHPETGKPEEVPVRNALNALKFLYQEAKNHFSIHNEPIENLYLIAYEHLHSATRSMIFYFENRLFENMELEKQIMKDLSMYYEAREVAGEQLKDKLIYRSK